jgi:high-affinity nickel permease
MFGQGIISYYQDKKVKNITNQIHNSNSEQYAKYNTILKQVIVGFFLILLGIVTIFIFVILTDPH